MLEETNFAALHPSRGGAPRSIGLLTNQTGVDAEGRRIVENVSVARSQQVGGLERVGRVGDL